MPGVETDDEADEAVTFRLDVPATNLADVSGDGRIAVEDGDEEGDDRADCQAYDDSPVSDHPGSGRKSCEAHVEEDDGNLD